MVSRTLKALGLLFLQIFLIVPTCMNTKMERASKSLDQYWAETGLDSTELESLLEDRSCLAEMKSFLACANSVSSMAARYNMNLTLDGELAPFTSDEIETLMSEKSQLKNWEDHYHGTQGALSFSFLEKWQEIDEKFVHTEERSAVIAAGINGFLSVFKDPHTYIIPVAQYEEVIANSDAKQDKLGFIFRRSGQKIVIKKVFEGSPADLAGLKKADEIIEINGKIATQLLPVQISEIIRLRQGQRLSLTVSRNGEKKYLELIKSDTVFPSVSAKILPGSAKLGLLTLHKFTKDVCNQTRTKLVGLMEEGIRGLLLDVRDNPGGQLDEAACIANLFVKKGTLLFETKYLDPLRSGDAYVAENSQLYSGPVAVLINSGSASASEILAGSLKDLGRATLVGEKSFGKGSFQDGHIWGSHTKVALFQTEGLYYFPSGWTPQLVGLQPDVPVAFNNSEQRESELYYNPLKPKDTWTGPQTVAWLQQFECDAQKIPFQDLNDLNPAVTEDVQIKEARGWLLCRAQGKSGILPQAENRQ